MVPTENDRPFEPSDFGIGRLFEHVQDAVLVANAATERIVLWNRCAEQMFGYAEEEALEMPLHTLVVDRLRARHRAGLARYQASGGGNLIDSGTPVELVALRKDATELPIELTLTKIPERTPEGHRFAMAIVRDISDRKAAEQGRLAERESQIQRRQALELNDTIVQGLAVAKMALERGKAEEGLHVVAETLETARGLVSRLLTDIEKKEGPLGAGDFVRDEPASITDPEPE